VNGSGIFDAADGSGNLWISMANFSEVMEFVRLTAPVVTPINPHQLGVEP
jgi:hypothetical protein